MDAHRELDRRCVQVNKEREAGMKELERSRQDIVRQRDMQSLVVGEADT